MSTTRRVLLLTPATSYRTSDFLHAAGHLDVDVIIGTNEHLMSAGFADNRIIHLDFHDCDACVDKISTVANSLSVSAIVGVDELTTLVAAAASEVLKLSHNPPHSLTLSHDKFAFRKTIKAAGLQSPEFRIVELSTLKSIAHSVTFPCVLKPLSLSASRGVIRVNSVGEFVEAGERINRILANVDRLQDEHRRLILCESFIPGREVALEGILHEGHLSVLALFDKPEPLDGPYFEETIYVTPSRLDLRLQSDIADTVNAACSALGLVTGPIHAELRVNDTGAWLIELAARSIGGRCSRSLRFGIDSSLEELILKLAVNNELPDINRESPASGVMMLPIRRAGELVEVNGIEEAYDVPGVSDVIIEIRPGELLVPLPEGDRYLGFIFARGESPAYVEGQLRQAERRLSVEIDPG